MKREEITTLARELFKIRVSAARGGLAENNDGVHQAKIDTTPFYDDKIMVQWYIEAIKTAKNILAYEEQYMLRVINNENYSAN
jgi:hypothetical protein